MSYGMTIHVTHISGKQMIAQGTDGCSHGSLMEEVMVGKDLLMFVDLAQDAIAWDLLQLISNLGRSDIR